MATFGELLSAGIIEKDINGDVLWTWAYPSVTSTQRELFIQKCGLLKDSPHHLQFIYSRCQHSWFYIFTSTINEETQTKLEDVTDVSLVLVTKDFNPERYETLARLFAQQYIESGNPSHLLEKFLSVITKGTCTNTDNGSTLSLSELSPKKSYANSNLRAVIDNFGVESILIYTALMLKKRVVVYCPSHSINDLLTFTRAIPAFVWHRQNWDILHPYVELNDEELAPLKTASHFVAGFVDAGIEGRSELYDIFVNVPTNQIVVSQKAKESLAMGKLHKDIAMTMVQAAENSENTDQNVIKEVANKTKELLNNLRSLADDDSNGKPHITLEKLRERKMPPATENFLFNVAVCEGLVQL